MESRGPTITPTYCKPCVGDNEPKRRDSMASSGALASIPIRATLRGINARAFLRHLTSPGGESSEPKATGR